MPLANHIMGTRFDLEVCRHFHPHEWGPAWLAEGLRLTRTLTLDGAGALDAILDAVESGASDASCRDLVLELSAGLRTTEHTVREGCRDLGTEIAVRLGRGRPLTDMGDRVATPLQTSRAAVQAVAS